MNAKTLFRALKALLCLGVILALCACAQEKPPDDETPEPPAQTAPPAETAEIPDAPLPTPEPTSEPTPEPQPETYLLSFVGDCTLRSS